MSANRKEKSIEQKQHLQFSSIYSKISSLPIPILSDSYSTPLSFLDPYPIPRASFTSSSSPIYSSSSLLSSTVPTSSSPDVLYSLQIRTPISAFFLLLVKNDQYALLRSLSKQTPPLKRTLSLFNFFLGTVSFLFVISVTE